MTLAQGTDCLELARLVLRRLRRTRAYRAYNPMMLRVMILSNYPLVPEREKYRHTLIASTIEAPVSVSRRP